MRIRLHYRSVLVASVLLALACRLQASPATPAPAATPDPSPAVPAVARIEGAYFSDQDNIAERIIAAINRTCRSLDIAVYSITQAHIAAAIEQAQRRGVRVRVVSDAQQAVDDHSEIPFLRSRGIAVRLGGGFRGQRSAMHNKFAIFDGNVVETGSFNWTSSANAYNFENAIFIADPEVAAHYEREFEHLWAMASDPVKILRFGAQNRHRSSF